MPKKAKRPCMYFGCPNLVEAGEKYCPEHKENEVQQQRQYDNERGTAAQRGYDARWRKARILFLRRHPICECDECKRLGRILPATVVDHIKPHKGDPKLFWDKNNWQAMAKSCHDRKTAKEDGGFGNG